MNKKAIFIVVAVLIIGFFLYIVVKNNMSVQNESSVENTSSFSNLDNIEQELTNETIEVVSEEEKTTPNTIFVLKKEYLDCDHIITKETEIPEELVNLTKEEIQEKYENWEIEEFSKEQVTLTISLDSFCGEHYLLKDENGYIKVYSVDEENSESLIKETDIYVDYLTQTDKINLENGLMVYGTDELNKLLEDFET